MVDSEINWYSKTVSETLLELDTSSEGLSSQEAEARLRLNGPNSLAHDEKNKTLKLLFRNFNSILIYILLVSAIISLLSSHMIELIVILIIIFFTGIFGFIQEYHAGKALNALSKIAVKNVEIMRDGKKVEIDKEEIVIGDIVLLKRGMIVPADIRIMESKGLSADESILTGESVQKYKRSEEINQEDILISDQEDILFAGTSITNGTGLGVVVATGLESEIGKISLRLKKIGFQKSPIQNQIDGMSKRIGIFVFFACTLLFLILIGKDFGLFQSLMLVSAMAVSGIPESFPLALTMSLSNGVKRMARTNAIVKDLSSVETLGTTTVICTDKTGTLTENKMRVERIFFSDGKEVQVKGHDYNPENEFIVNGSETDARFFEKYPEFFNTCVLCNNANLALEGNEWKLSGEPTEGSILSLAKSTNYNDHQLRKDNKQIKEVAFDPFEKFMISVNEHENEKTAYLKGAYEQVIRKCKYIRTSKGIKKLTASHIKTIENQAHKYSDLTLRMLALATKSIRKIDESLETGFIFEGMVGIDDPIRKEAFKAIEECQSANVKVIMITGDHKKTAESVGRKLGIVTSEKDMILEGHELDKMTDEDLDKVIHQVAIFSRTTPDHKFRIVNSLQRKGEIVAMTGDGVNDAPSLKKADIGVSMGKSGTDVAREASNMILTDDHFSTIVNAIREGRTIYSNIRRFIYYLLTGNATEVLLIFLAVLIGIITPLTALMILFINLITSTFPALALSIEKTHLKVMKQKPRNPDEKLLSNYILLKIFVLVPLILLGTLALFLWELNITGGEIEKARTLAFAALIIFELMHAFNARNLHTTIFSKDFFSNKYIFIAVFISLSLTIVAIYTNLGQSIFQTTALNLTEWLIIIGVSSLVIVVSETIKALIKSEFKEQKRLKGLEISVE